MQAVEQQLQALRAQLAQQQEASSDALAKEQKESNALEISLADSEKKVQEATNSLATLEQFRQQTDKVGASSS